MFCLSINWSLLFVCMFIHTIVSVDFHVQRCNFLCVCLFIHLSFFICLLSICLNYHNVQKSYTCMYIFLFDYFPVYYNVINVCLLLVASVCFSVCMYLFAYTYYPFFIWHLSQLIFYCYCCLFMCLCVCYYVYITVSQFSFLLFLQHLSIYFCLTWLCICLFTLLSRL